MGYATLADLLTCGLPAAAIASIDDPTRQAALDDRSAYADTYLGDKETLPLLAPYDRTLVRYVCFLAAWDLICFRGFNPDNPGDAIVRQRYEDADKWLVRVANGQARLAIVRPGTAPQSLQPDVGSNCPRGIGDMFGNNSAADDPVAGSSGGWGI